LQQLLKPGFHSGTVPKLYARWRRAEREAHKWGAHRAALACREKLKNLENTVKRFVERAVLDLVNQSPEWRDSPLGVGPITLATNLVRIEFRHAPFPQTAVRLVIAEEENLLVAQVEEDGWVGQLTPGQRRTFLHAVAGLYKLAGVDLVQEQLQSSLPSGSSWRAYDGALAIRFQPDGPEVVYDLYLQGRLQPRPESPRGPLLDPLRTVFGRSPFPWRDWANGWQKDGLDTETLPPVLELPS
jgi:hypothetical protein